MQTVCSVMNYTDIYKQMLPERHKLANLLVLDHVYKNINLRYERPFTALKHLLITYEQQDQQTS